MGEFKAGMEAPMIRGDLFVWCWGPARSVTRFRALKILVTSI